MKKSKRNFALGILGLTAILIASIGAGYYPKTQIGVNALSAQASIDTLGNFEWTPTVGATGYKWSYKIGDNVSEIYETETNKVNVGVALTKAAQAAVAKNNADDDETNDVPLSITFNVTPVTVNGDGETLEYPYSSEKYINYGYVTHDLKEVKAQATGFTKISELCLDGSLEGWISSAMFKNDVLTIGMRADETLDENGLDFALFGMYEGASSLGNYNYRIAQKPDGSVSVGIKTAQGGEWYQTYAAETNFNNALEKGKPYYLAMAVFDTYDTTGKVIGETVYYSRSEYDKKIDELKQVGGFELFVDKGTVEEKALVYKTTPSLTLASYATVSMEVDISGLYISTNGYNESTYISSGIPTYKGLSAPTGLYYDNIDQTFNWNSVAGASGYEWKVGDGEWRKTISRKVDISKEMVEEEYTSLTYLPIQVRAIGGKAARYNFDLSRYYKGKSTVADYLEYFKNGEITKSKNDISFPSSVSGSYAPSGYTYKNCKDNDGTPFGYGTYVTSRITIKAESSASTRIYWVGLLGPTSHKGDQTCDRYYIALYGDGTVQVASGATPWANGTTSRTNKSKYWRIQNVTDKFRIGYTYYLTYGVDKVYERDENGNEVLAAYRVSVRIEERVGIGLDRKLLGIVSYDNERVEDTADNKYVIEDSSTIYGNTSKSYVTTYRSLGDETADVANIKFKIGDEIIAEKATYFGAVYDFTEINEMELPDGYEKILGWTYTTTAGLVKEFPLQGWYGSSRKEMIVEAKTVAAQYSVEYLNACENPTVYTTDSDFVLQAPTETPDDGSVFDAWYLESDTNFENPIISLKGLTGDLTLVARFAKKYRITVITENGTMEYFYSIGGNENMELVAPEMENKTFLGWSVATVDGYTAYEGATTFVPTQSAVFKAEYAWTEYEITYVTNGGTHENADTYTVNELVTFTDAKKSSYLFVGWYADSEYLTKVTDTENFVGNVTVYAKFIKNTLPKIDIPMERSVVAQTLPVPELPYGATYEVTLVKGGEELTVTDNQYAFDETGEYLLQYVIRLETGECVEYTVTYLVGNKYTVNIHYGNGEMITLEKIYGEKISEGDLPEIPDGYKFGGVYLDSTYGLEYDLATEISCDIDVYLKWIPVQTDTSEQNGCSGSVGGSFVGAITALCSVAYVFLKRKN